MKYLILSFILIISILCSCNSNKKTEKTDSEMAEYLMAEYIKAPEVFEPQNNFEELAEDEIRNSLKDDEILSKFWVTRFDTLLVLDSLQRIEAIAQQDSQIIQISIQSFENQLVKFKNINTETHGQDSIIQQKITILTDSLTRFQSHKDSLNLLLTQLHEATVDLPPPPNSYVVMCGFMITNPSGKQLLYAGELDFLESFELIRKRVAQVEY